MKKYKAAIFDLDGTLLNTLEDLRDAVNHTMDKFGFERRSHEEVRAFVGSGVTKLIELCVPNGQENPDFSGIVEEYRKFYAANSEIKTKPYDGITELISLLHDSGIKVAVVSNKMHEATVTLCKKYFPEISSVYGEREADGIRRKPYPDMLFTAVENLGENIGDCVFVGDSEVDVITAKNAGIDCISVLWGFRDRDFLKAEGASVFAENARELFDLITENHA